MERRRRDGRHPALVAKARNRLARGQEAAAGVVHVHGVFFGAGRQDGRVLVHGQGAEDGAG